MQWFAIKPSLKGPCTVIFRPVPLFPFDLPRATVRSAGGHLLRVRKSILRVRQTRRPRRTLSPRIRGWRDFGRCVGSWPRVCNSRVMAFMIRSSTVPGLVRKADSFLKSMVRDGIRFAPVRYRG